MARPKTSNRSRSGLLPRSISETTVSRGIQPRADPNKVYRFSQFATEFGIQQTALTPSFQSSYWQLNSLDQYAAFTTLFDQYRIVEIEAEYRPMYTANSVALGQAVLVPLIYTAVDYDDSTAWTTLAQAREYQNASIHSTETFTVKFKPHVAMAAYGGGVFTNFANAEGQWLDAASNAIPHYGIKTAVTAGSNAQTSLQQWNVSARLTVEFRNVR